MAASISAKRLQDEVSCFLCHKYFSDPVCIDCGHSFCQKCITQFWDRDPSCPQCGQRSLERNFRPNKELRNIVQIAKRMKVKAASVAGEILCEIHQEEPPKFFCVDEQKLLCRLCLESKDHAGHRVVPAEEAAMDYKAKLEIQLQAWKEKQEKDISFHAEEENKHKRFLEKLAAEKEKIVSEFEEVEEFVKQQKIKLLDQLEDLAKKGEMFVAKLSSNVYFADTLIHEMEEKSQQPADKFLQDIETILSRGKIWDLQDPSISSELEEELCVFSKKHNVLRETLREITDFLSKQLNVKWVNVTLDPDTSNAKLHISADKKTVTNPQGVQYTLVDYPQRFVSPCVLGCPGFTSGRHYWEVKVEDNGEWAVGVARESVKRKEHLSLPKEGIWDVRRDFWGFMTNNLQLKCSIPETVGVYLDYGGNRVLFFDADEGTLLHAFTSTSFNREKIRPFFWLQSGSLSLI